MEALEAKAIRFKVPSISAKQLAGGLLTPVGLVLSLVAGSWWGVSSVEQHLRLEASLPKTYSDQEGDRARQDLGDYSNRLSQLVRNPNLSEPEFQSQVLLLDEETNNQEEVWKIYWTREVERRTMRTKEEGEFNENGGRAAEAITLAGLALALRRPLYRFGKWFIA